MIENDGRKRDGAQLLLRFAEGSDLRETLKRKAAFNGRTLTAEILFRLEKSLTEEAVGDISDSRNNDVATLRRKIAELEHAFLHHVLHDRSSDLDARISSLEAKIK